MPELPEVETIVRGLRPAIAGATITAVRVGLERVVAPPAAEFAAHVIGRRVAGVRRRAKYVLIDLDDASMLVVHLRMTGRLIYDRDGSLAVPKYTNVELDFADGARLCFADARTFGRMRRVAAGEVWGHGLGVEPLSPEFTPERLAALLRGRRGAVKTLLLDQRVIAGIGNIYACEALWQARIAPATPAEAIGSDGVFRLHVALVDVLERAVALRGTSARDYVDAEGLKGGFQNVLSVYGRDGEACPRCTRPIVRTVLAQRGTWWCRGCQRPRRARGVPPSRRER